MNMFLTGLARVARDAGLTVREVPGWRTRTAHAGGMNKVHGVIWHHTATAAAAVKSRNNPTLNYMINGLGYPLANYGLAWDGSLDVIAAGTGAHAGKGSYKGIPNNDGNRHLIGVEVEGTIGLDWSPAQLEAAARLGAQLNRDFGTNLLHIGHYEWAPGRKTDPTGIPGNMPALRAAIQRGHWSNINPAGNTTNGSTITTKEGLPMSAAEVAQINAHTTNEINRALDYIADRTSVNPGEGTSDERRSLARVLGGVEANLNKVPADVWDHKVAYRDQSRNASRTMPAAEALYNISWGNAKTIDALTTKEA